MFKALACGLSIGVTLASWFASSEILGCRGVQELLMHTQSAQSCRQSIPRMNMHIHVYWYILLRTDYGLRSTDSNMQSGLVV